MKILLFTFLATYCFPQSKIELETGWYSISDKETDIKRNVNKSDQTYYLLPGKIIGLENFQDLMRIDSFSFENKVIPQLLLQLDSLGTKKLEAATIKYLNKKLAFILDDRLICVLKIEYPIKGGQVSIWHESYDKYDLETIMNKIKTEINLKK